MKFLNYYDRFSFLIKEEVDPTTSAVNASTTTSPTGIDTWFNQGWYNAAKSDVRMDDTQKDKSKGMVEELQKLKGGEPFGSVKGLQAYLWDQMTKLQCPITDKEGKPMKGKDGNDIKPMPLIDVLNNFRKTLKPPRGPMQKEPTDKNTRGFIDGKYGKQTDMILDMVICQYKNKLNLEQGELNKALKTKEQILKAVTNAEIIAKGGTVSGANTTGVSDSPSMNYILNELQCEDTNDTIKGAAENKSSRIKIKDKGDKKLTLQELDAISAYLNKMGYVLLKVVDKKKSFFHKLFGSKGVKYVWVRNEKKAEEIAKLAAEGEVIEGGKAELNADANRDFAAKGQKGLPPA